MPTEAWVAIIAAVGGLLTGLVTAFWTPFVAGRFERRQSAAQLRDTYSPPLLQAAFDLQSRLYNIVREQFLDAYYRSEDKSRHDYAEHSTLWLIGQYLGWVEILRQGAQYLDFGSRKKNQGLQRALLKIAEVMASDKIADPPAIYRTTQRAIAESMIEQTGEATEARARTLGYSEFVRRLEEGQQRWFDDLRKDLSAVAERRRYGRLVEIQRALIDLIDELDPARTRIPNLDIRGKLPLRRQELRRTDPCETIARFTVRPSEYGARKEGFPRSRLSSWSTRHRMEEVPTLDSTESEFRRPLGVLGNELHVHTDYRNTVLEIRAGICPPRWALRLGLIPPSVNVGSGAFPLAISRRRARRILNALLTSFDRPRLI